MKTYQLQDINIVETYSRISLEEHRGETRSSAPDVQGQRSEEPEPLPVMD